jgi:hypothetical protein
MNTTRNLFARAAQQQTLTPAERALLRLVEGLAATALVAAAVAVLLALVKYARAFGDPPLEGTGVAASSVTSEPGQSDLAGDGANG